MSKNKRNITASEKEAIMVEPIFNIRGMELLRFSLSPYQKESPKEFQFEAEVNQEMVLKDKVFISKITLSIKDDEGIILGNLSLSCIFEVENLNEIILDKNSAIQLGLTLNQVTISTARGVMFGLFRGTILQNAVLPIVDATAFKTRN